MPKASNFKDSVSVANILSHCVLGLLLLSGQAALAQGFPAVDCVINPNKIVDLSSPVPGVLKNVKAEKSEYVEQGQVVAELNSDVERATVKLARARAEIDSEIAVSEINFEFDQRKLTRMDSLYGQKAVSFEHKDEAERNLRLSDGRLKQAKDLQSIRKLELARAEEQLDQKTIRSPISGFVIQKLKKAGEYVEDVAILRIAQLDPLKIDAIVPMELYGKIIPGMKANVFPEMNSGQAKLARVSVVDRVGDAAGGTFGVQLTLPNPDYNLPAGMKCALKFVALTEQEKADSKKLKASVSKKQTKADVAVTPTKNRTTNKPPQTTLPLDVKIGPFSTDEHAIIAKMFDNEKLAFKSTVSQEFYGGDYIVLSKKMPSQSKANGLANQFRTAGIDDIQIMGKGRYEGQVSLGVFASLARSTRRLHQLSKLGLEISVEQLQREQTLWWIEMEHPPNALITARILKETGKFSLTTDSADDAVVAGIN